MSTIILVLMVIISFIIISSIIAIILYSTGFFDSYTKSEKEDVEEETPVSVEEDVEEETPVSVEEDVEEETPVSVEEDVEEETPVSTPAPVDCVTSEWGEWSGCVNGNKTRTKKIIRKASNGGKCPDQLSQSLKCSGHLCNEWGKCVHAYNAYNGTNIQQKFKNNEKGQVWTITPEGNICNEYGKCLAARENSGEDIDIIQWDKTTEKGQKWNLSSDGYLCNEWGKCLHAENDKDGLGLVQRNKQNVKGQKWTIPFFGSCYGAKSVNDCVTCEDVINAYKNKRWAYDTSKFKQCG